MMIINKNLTTNYTDTELVILQKFLENFIIGILKSLKAKDITYYANNNKIADPRPVIYSLPEGIKVQIRNILKENPNLLDNYMNYGFILDLFKRYRKDLLEVLGLSKNKVWFTKYIRILQKILENI